MIDEMKKVITILIMVFVSTWSMAQTSYFNMRYRQAHSLGGGVKAISIKNNEIYFNVFAYNDTTNLAEQIFSKISLIDGAKTTLFALKNDSLDQFGSEILSSKTGGVVDVIAMGHLGVAGSPWQLGVIKYDTNGDTLFFNMDIGSALYHVITGTYEKDDHDIAMVGTEQLKIGAQGGSEDILLLETDSLGNELWRKSIGDSTHHEQGYCISGTSDGGFIIGGLKRKEGDLVQWEYERPWLIKTDSIGNIEWNRFYGPKDTLNLPIYDVTPTLDGGYAFVGGIGALKYVHASSYLPWIVKVNALGDTLWTRTIYGSGPDAYYSQYKSMVELADGSLVVCGEQRIPNADTINLDGLYRITGVITKYSAQGELLWSRNYSHPGNNLSISSEHHLESIVSTPDGGFAAAGWLSGSPPDTGLQDVWVIKVDSFGCLTPGCQLTSVPKIESSIAQLKIYPNPATEEVHFDITPNLQNHRKYELKLYDMAGKLVLTKKLYPYENAISVSHLKAGIYNYRLNETWGQVVIQ